MDNALRLQYLEAMGIDVWVPRALVQNEQQVSSDSATDNLSLIHI